MNCMVENRHEVEDTKCKGFLNKMAAIIFSDYRLIKGFYDDCVEDIKHTKCGQITRPDDDEAVCFLFSLFVLYIPTLFLNLWAHGRSDLTR